jgi:hypothetical protein
MKVDYSSYNVEPYHQQYHDMTKQAKTSQKNLNIPQEFEIKIKEKVNNLSKLWTTTLKKSQFQEIAHYFQFNTNMSTENLYFEIYNRATNILGLKFPEEYADINMNTKNLQLCLEKLIDCVSIKMQEISQTPSSLENEIMLSLDKLDVSLLSLIEDNPSFKTLTNIEQMKIIQFANHIDTLSRSIENPKEKIELSTHIINNQRLLESILKGKDLNQVIGVEQKEIWSCSVLSILVKSLQINPKAINIEANSIYTKIEFPSSRFNLAFYSRSTFINFLLKEYGITFEFDNNLYIRAINIPNNILKDYQKSITKSEAMVPQAAITGTELLFALYKKYGNAIKTIKDSKDPDQLHGIYKEQFLHHGINIFNIGNLLGCNIKYAPTKTVSSIDTNNYEKYFILYDSKYRGKFIRAMHFGYFSIVDEDNFTIYHKDGGLLSEDDSEDEFENIEVNKKSKTGQKLVINTLQEDESCYKDIEDLGTKKYSLISVSTFQ